MEIVKIQKSVFFRVYRFDQQPPPLRKPRWWALLLSLFSARAAHVLDREVGHWLPPERRELWLGRLQERKERIR